MSGIYIHIPFCKQACTYCDFHFSTSLKRKDELIDSLVKEISLRSSYLSDPHIGTVYFGGGTPSILTQKDLGRMMDSLQHTYQIDTDAEITLECNPDDLTNTKLRELKHLGINRLSIGLQSFDETELKWMNRAHTAAESESSVKRAQDAGFENITIDLIYGSRFQNMAQWKQTLYKAIALDVKHISAYNLTIEERTKLGHDFMKEKEPAIDDEKSSEFFLEMSEILEKHDFIHYEISNFGKKDFFSRHNTNYWKGVHYLGLGPSAHSYNGTGRQWNIANNARYIESIGQGKTDYYETETLGEKERFNEYMLTGLRTMWGVSLDYIKAHFSQETYFHFLAEVKKHMEREHILEKESIFTLSKNGRLLADRIASELFI
ncbi:MAG: radical SAM family heme chaperone HemW [Bacteroidetes bacterium]|nr:radical SAM family heme chaperone HemW [Bacteroidota bacterium]